MTCCKLFICLPAIALQSKQHIWHSHCHTPCSLCDHSYIFQNCPQEACQSCLGFIVSVDAYPLDACNFVRRCVSRLGSFWICSGHFQSTCFSGQPADVGFSQTHDRCFILLVTYARQTTSGIPLLRCTVLVPLCGSRGQSFLGYSHLGCTCSQLQSGLAAGLRSGLYPARVVSVCEARLTSSCLQPCKTMNRIPDRVPGRLGPRQKH